MRFLASLGLLLVLSCGEPHGVADLRPASAVAGERAALAEGLAVLHAWDARREEAWAAGDEAALRSLYEPGSGAGRADARLLRAYAARGLVVRRIVTQVFAVRVLHRGTSVLRLRVLDRVAGGEVVRGGRPRALGSSPPVSRDVALRRGPDGWRVASVSGSGRGPRAARR